MTLQFLVNHLNQIYPMATLINGQPLQAWDNGCYADCKIHVNEIRPIGTCLNFEVTFYDQVAKWR